MKKDMKMFRDMAAKWIEFQNIEDERERDGWCPLICVAWSSLYRAKYVTRLELVEGKFSNEGKVFDKVSGFISGFLFFSQKKKVWDFNATGAAVTAVSHSYSYWMMSSEWHLLLEENIWH